MEVDICQGGPMPPMAFCEALCVPLGTGGTTHSRARGQNARPGPVGSGCIVRDDDAQAMFTKTVTYSFLLCYNLC